jgi:hypothetical protein
MQILLAELQTSAGRFFEGLSEGDPVAWGILGVIVAFSAFGLYQKFRSF